MEKIHLVRPGITDPASIIYRNEELLLSIADDPENAYKNKILPHKLSLYEKYIEKNSIVGDIKILLLTVIKLFK